MSKKFYMIVRDEYGNVIFNHKSDKVKRLIALYNKEAKEEAEKEDGE